MSKTGRDEDARFILLRGPMFSGKSTEMTRLLGCESAVCENPEAECIIFKYKHDIRYGSNSEQALITHGGGSAPAIGIGRADEIRLILAQHLVRLAYGQGAMGVRYAADRVREMIAEFIAAAAAATPDAEEPVFVVDEPSHGHEPSQEQLKAAITLLTNITLSQLTPTTYRGPLTIISGRVHRLVDHGVRMVGIDEGQFLPGLLEVVQWLVEEQGVSVVVSALDLNFRGEPWAETLRLQAYPPDEDIKLKARCKECRSADGIYSFYYQEPPPPPQAAVGAAVTTSASSSSKSEDVPEGLNASTFKIGGAERYKPLCRSCYRSACQRAAAAKQ